MRNKISVKQEKVCSTRFPPSRSCPWQQYWKPFYVLFLPLSIENMPHGRLYGRLCRTRAFSVQRIAQRLFGPQCYLSSFQLFKQKWWSRRRFNRFLPLLVKGPFCVEVLSTFYGRFFVEEGQFINSTSSLHLCRHFFYLLTPPRFGALNRESESSGSQPVYRKLFPRGLHSSKNNFFEIKISRPTPLESRSVLLWLLSLSHVISPLIKAL